MCRRNGYCHVFSVFVQVFLRRVCGFGQKNADSAERNSMIASETMPGETLKTDKMPGHWLLARLGKRVLRPGGRQLTHRMIEALNIGPSDAVIEFAPGL